MRHVTRKHGDTYGRSNGRLIIPTNMLCLTTFNLHYVAVVGTNVGRPQQLMNVDTLVGLYNDTPAAVVEELGGPVEHNEEWRADVDEHVQGWCFQEGFVKAS